MTAVTANVTGPDAGSLTHVTAIDIAMYVIEHQCSIAEAAQALIAETPDSSANCLRGTSSANQEVGETVSTLTDNTTEVNPSAEASEDDVAGFTVPNWAEVVDDYAPDSVDGSKMRICTYVEGDEAVVSPRGLVADAVSVVVRGAEGQVRDSKGAMTKQQGVDIVIRHRESEDLWQLTPRAALEVGGRLISAARKVNRRDALGVRDLTHLLDPVSGVERISGEHLNELAADLQHWTGTEEAARAAVADKVPLFAAPPVELGLPPWPTEGHEWEWGGAYTENTYHRLLRRSYRTDEGYGFDVDQMQEVDGFGTLREVDGANISFDLEEHSLMGPDVAERARQIAAWLNEAADLLAAEVN